MKHTRETLTLTIVIPAYNEQEIIVQCLDSISSQTVKPEEVILVDNNSVDKTAETAKKYPFVRVVSEKKQGIVFARSAGFDEVRSDIIARIDADTVLPADWVENVVEYFAFNSASAITGPCHIRDWYGKWIFFWLHRAVFFASTRLFVGHNTLFGSNMAVSRSAWLKVRAECCERIDLHEDMDLASHLKINGMAIEFVREIEATISPRRITRMSKYPKMWLKTNMLHNRIALMRSVASEYDQ